MILLTVLRPHPPRKVTARYDDQNGYWLCEDAALYRVLRGLQLPGLRYYPDPDLALVQYAAKIYHGEVTDLRPPAPEEPPGRLY